MPQRGERRIVDIAVHTTDLRRRQLLHTTVAASVGCKAGTTALSEREKLNTLRSIQTIAQLATVQDPLWFCLKSQPKREHLVASGLRRQLGIACISPRLRFRRATRRGAIWFVEAMFPGYIFAEFVYAEKHRAVEYSAGVQYIVHFGQQVATIPADAIATLSEKAGDDEIVTIDSEIEVGQEVQIVEGPLHGFDALVTQVLPAKERVRVLLEFLGRPVETELSTPRVLSAEKPRPS